MAECLASSPFACLVNLDAIKYAKRNIINILVYLLNIDLIWLAILCKEHQYFESCIAGLAPHPGGGGESSNTPSHLIL